MFGFFIIVVFLFAASAYASTKKHGVSKLYSYFGRGFRAGWKGR